MNAECSHGQRKDWLAALACGFIAAFVAAAPHLAVGPPYFASGDDVIYLAIARPAYHGEGRLRDPYAAASANVPTAFSWTQFVPFTAPLKWIGIPFLRTIFAWQLLGGFLTGATLYLALRIILAGQARAAALAVLLVWLGDAGTICGRPLLDSAMLVKLFAAGEVRKVMATEYNQYRVVSPLLSYPFLLLVLTGFAAPSRSYRRALLTGLPLGVLVLMYFFFWTAAVGALGMYLLIQIGRWLRTNHPDAKIEARFTFIVLAVGLALGGYQVLSNAMTFADPAYRPALDRTSLGYRMPKGDPIRSRYLVAVWPMMELAVGAIALWKTRNRGLGLMMLLTLSGYLLKNSAIVTGLEFENYHWNFIQNSFGSLTLFVSAVLLLPRLAWLLLPLGMAMVAFAFAWRMHEAKLAAEPRQIARWLHDTEPLAEALAALSADTMLAGPKIVDVAILRSRCGQLYQHPHVSHRSLIPDAEVHERHALNGWLQGLSEADYATTARDPKFSMTESERAEWQPEAVLSARLAVFRILDTPAGSAIIAKYSPLALLLPTGETPKRGGRWRKLASGPDWNLWQRMEGEP